MWDCPTCGARVDGGIDRCWGCGGRRPAGVEDDEPEDDDLDPDDTEAGAVSWSCPKCGNRLGPEFDTCWKCGTTIDGVEDPLFAPADVGPVAMTLDCPKCKGVMSEGFLAAETDRAYWVSAAAGRTPSGGSGEPVVRGTVRVFRCDDCNFLEFYARE